MFTGLIEEIGRVVRLSADSGGARLTITAPQLGNNTNIGDSIAVNGCCLTVAAREANELRFDLLGETLQRTNLGTLRANCAVNLEPALAATARLGGHFVQGHVDCAARILSFERREADYRLEIELPREFAHYVASKGSVAVNGISLTVANVQPQSFVVWIIPHTRERTNLNTAQAGDVVNLEFDLLAKYVERMLDRRRVSE